MTHRHPPETFFSFHHTTVGTDPVAAIGGIALVVIIVAALCSGHKKKPTAAKRAQIAQALELNELFRDCMYVFGCLGAMAVVLQVFFRALSPEIGMLGFVVAGICFALGFNGSRATRSAIGLAANYHNVPLKGGRVVQPERRKVTT